MNEVALCEQQRYCQRQALCGILAPEVLFQALLLTQPVRLPMVDYLTHD
jgi:hypothetical protein